MSTKVDRRIVKTKDAIFQSFLSLIAEKNFEEITINEIAERANVNRGTIYFHYTDKYDLLDRCIEVYLNKMSMVSTTIDANGNTIDLLQSSLLPIVHYFEEHYTFYASMFANKGVPTFRQRLLDIVIENIRMHINMEDDNKPYNKEFITHFMASAFVGTIEWWIVNQMPQSPDEMSDQLWGLLKRNQVIH
jgi:AcrR family transcriptional regulator